MRELLSTYGSCRNVESMLGLTLQSRALNTEVQVFGTPDFDAPVSTGVMPIGVWQ
jgi:hypothetical protein